MFKKIVALVMSVAVLAIVTACSTTRPIAENWALPKKERADSAMIIGRIDHPISKKENPEGYRIYLSEVNYMAKRTYFGNGEPNITLDNNYFVVHNIKPGKYWLMGFQAGKLYNRLPLYEEDYAIEVKAGQIKFAGSFDYLLQDNRFLFAHSYKFNVRKAEKPSELEMFQWLNRVSAGSGWEPAIKKRIRELGGKP